MGQGDRSHMDRPGTQERIRAASPLGIALEPSDHAGAYLLLASKEHSRGITGTVINTDAGARLRWTPG